MEAQVPQVLTSAILNASGLNSATSGGYGLSGRSEKAQWMNNDQVKYGLAKPE